MQEGGNVIPATGKIFGQLVQCHTMADAVRLRGGAPPVAGTSFLSSSSAASASGAAGRVLSALATLDSEACSHAHSRPKAELYDVREMHVDRLYRLGELVPLSKPFEAFGFDWLAPPSSRRASVKVPVTYAGTAHAVLLWWQLGMDQEGTLLLSTAPCWVVSVADGADEGPLEGVAQQWRDHWKQVWLPLAAQHGLQVSAFTQ